MNEERSEERRVNECIKDHKSPKRKREHSDKRSGKE